MRMTAVDAAKFLDPPNSMSRDHNKPENATAARQEETDGPSFFIHETASVAKLRGNGVSACPMPSPGACAWYCNGPVLACTTPPNPKSSEMMFSSTSGLPITAKSASLEESLSWDPQKTPQGRGIQISNQDLTVETPQPPQGYVTQVSKQIFRSGKHKIVLKFDKNLNDDSFYLGVGDAGRGVPTSSGSNSGMWTMQADGYTYASGDSSSGGPRIRRGSFLTFILDLIDSRAQFITPPMNHQCLPACPQYVLEEKLQLLVTLHHGWVPKGHNC